MVKIGIATLYAQVPDKLISYGSPRLIQKYNDGVKSEAEAPGSSRESFTPLHPVFSNMEELYNRDDDSVLKNVKIEIVFDNLEETARPPSISQIECNIVAWSYRTDYPIPVSFEHDFFYTKPNDSDCIIYADDVENTKVNLLNLKELVNNYIDFLKESKTYITLNTYSYLKGLSKLGVKKDSIKEYFQTILPTTHHLILSEDNWIAHQIEKGKLRWTKEMLVPLRVVNKNNITLPPSFQSCLVGRLYCLQLVVKLKGAEEPANTLIIDVPVLIG
ncbi:CIC11C00000001264 [Sungouiella intermedia]|uniref:CIC11C00000001264 n=1 Tax=Sungouiella intermedia TaxID=45354 RepID=A0A1L0BJE0_9ASCO|nr:CIC11C00000001264 [[Candida] intermedia]